MNESINKALASPQGQNFSFSNQQALQNAKDLNVAKANLQTVEAQLTEKEKQRYQQELKMIQIQQQETQEVADRITKLQQEKEAILDKAEATQLSAFGQDNAKQGSREIQNNVDIYRQAMQNSVAEDGTDANVDHAVDAYMRARDAAVQYQDT